MQVPDHGFISFWLSNYLYISISDCSPRLCGNEHLRNHQGNSNPLPLLTCWQGRKAMFMTTLHSKNTPKYRKEAAASISLQSWLKTWALGKTHRMPEGNQGSTHRSNKYTEGQVANTGLRGHRGASGSPRPADTGVNNPEPFSCRGDASRPADRLVQRSSRGTKAVFWVPSKPRKRGVSGRGGETRGDICRARWLPKARRAALARPSPSAEGTRTPAGGKRKRRAVPCRVRESARRWLHQRPGGARRPGRGGGTQTPALRRDRGEAGPARPGRKMRRPAEGQGRGRTGGGAGRGLGREAGPGARPSAVPAGGARRRRDSPLQGEGRSFPLTSQPHADSINHRATARVLGITRSWSDSNFAPACQL